MAPPFPNDPEELLAHDPFVRGVARRLLADEHRVDDVVQETWLAALRRGPGPGGSLRAWLATVARHFAIDARRRDAAREARERAAARPETAPSMDEIYAREAIRRRLIDAVAALPEATRAVFLLRFFDGLPPRKIAGRLGLPVETVKTRLKRGLEAVRARLEHQESIGGKHWAAWLAPVAAAPAPLLPAHLGRAAARTAEILTMSTKTKIGIAAVLIAGISVFLWQMAPGEGARGGETAGGAARSEPPMATAAKAPEAAIATAAAAGPPPTSRESAASAPVAAKPKLAFPTGGLRVKAVWKDGKAPAPGVGLRIRTLAVSRGYESQQKITGADGIATFPELPVGKALVEVDRTIVSVLVEIPADTTKETVAEIEPGADVDVTVVDGLGSPIEGAGVWISETHLSATSRLELGKTPADGRFTVRSLGKEVFLGAELESRTPSTPALVSPKGGDRLAVRLVLDLPGCAVEGRVVGADKSPVAGCAILLGIDEPIWRPGEPVETAVRRPIPRIVHSDAAGRFRAAGLAAGTHSVAARADGHGLFMGSIDVAAGAPTPFDIALPAPAAVVGRVVDSAGRPLEGARVHTKGPRSFTFLESASGADGRYRLEGLAPGRAEVQANYGQAPSASTTLFLDEGAELRWDPIFPASPEIRGRVVDETGAPLRGWLVRAVEASLNGRVFGLPKITTDDQGRFVVPRCRDVEYVVEAIEPANPQKGEDFEEVRAASGSAERVRPGLAEVVIVVTPETRPNCYVTATVEDPEGRPIGNATVLAGVEGSAAMSQIPCNPATAAFKLGPLAAARKHRLRIEAPGFTRKLRSIDGLVPNTTKDLGAIRMERGGTLLVEVRRADGALPEILNGFAGLGAGDTPGEGFGESLQRDGSLFRSKPLAPGKYSLVFLGGDVARARTPVEVVDGKETKVDVLLRSGHARTIAVTRAGSAPVGVVAVRVTDDSGAFISEELAFAAGGSPVTCKVWLAPGRYRLAARDESGATGEAKLDVAGADASTLTIDLR